MLYDNSGVTVELGELISTGFPLWDFEYKSFYEGADKAAFEEKVIDHYWFRQIGQETPARFKRKFRTLVRELAPYYYQLYKSVELMETVDDPFKAYDLTETYTENTSGTGRTTGTASGTTTGKSTSTNTLTVEGTDTTVEDKEHRHSDTPQGSIANLDTYMTDADREDNTTTLTVDRTEGSTGGGTTEATTDSETETMDEMAGEKTYTLTRQGNIGVQPLGQEINAYRSALINVDMMFIEALNDLFLKIY